MPGCLQLDRKRRLPCPGAVSDRQPACRLRPPRSAGISCLIPTMAPSPPSNTTGWGSPGCLRRCSGKAAELPPPPPPQRTLERRCRDKALTQVACTCFDVVMCWLGAGCPVYLLADRCLLTRRPVPLRARLPLLLQLLQHQLGGCGGTGSPAAHCAEVSGAAPPSAAQTLRRLGVSSS